MTRVLITAFEPYDHWSENASWLCLVELTRNLPAQPEVTTRRYPVDFTRVRQHLEEDLTDEYDYAIHLGQGPGGGRLGLEDFAINAARERSGPSHTPPPAAEPLDPEGPAAYQSTLPLHDWAELLCGGGIPASVSHHAGTYLCNATLYWSRRIAERRGLRTQALFIHVPLETSQVIATGKDTASLPAGLVADGVRLILEAMHNRAP